MATTLQRSRDTVRGIWGLATLLLLVLGVPALLVLLGSSLLGTGNPLAGLDPPWQWRLDGLADSLTHAVDQDTIITTLCRAGLVMAWAAFAVLLANVVIEWRTQRAHGVSLRPVRGLGWSQAVASRLVAGLLALSTVVPNHLAAAQPLATRAPVTATAAPPARNASLAPPAHDAASDMAWGPYRVAKGDSVYGIAMRLADGDRARTRQIAQQILDHNLGRTMTDGQRFTTPGYIEAGWILDIPEPAPSPTTPPAATPTPVAPPEADHVDTWTVRRGESYWVIADHHLEAVLGDEPTEAQVLAHTHELLAANADRYGHRTPRHLIHPGETLVLPKPNGMKPPAPPAVLQSTVAPAEQAPPPSVPAAAEAPAAAPEAAGIAAPLVECSEPAAPAASEAAAPPATTAVDNGEDSLGSPAAPVIEPSVASDPPSDSTRSSDPQVVAPDPFATPWTKLVIGSLFATGVVATVWRLRRRRFARRRPGHRFAPAPPSTRTTEAVLTAAAKPDRIASLRALLAGLPGRYRLTRGEAALIRAVQLEEDEVELLWSSPQPEPPAGWTTTDGGWSWRHPVTDAPPPGDDPVLLPTLVTAGWRDEGSELLLDLEAAGSLAITGDPLTAEALLRAIVVGLGTSPLVDTMDILFVGGRINVDTMERIRVAELGDAVRWAKARADETRVVLDERKHATTLAARLTPRKYDTWDPVLVVVMEGLAPAQTELVNELVSAAQPGSGVVAVFQGDIPTAQERIACIDGRAQWESTGIGFTPMLVPAEAEDDLEALLSHAASATETNAPVTAALLDDRAPAMVDGACEEAGDRSTAVVIEPEYDVLVRVLGEVAVEGAPERLTEGEVELLALLASLRADGPINIDRLATLLSRDEWQTPKTRSVQTRISRLRAKLGVGRDGQPLVPDSRPGNNSPGRYTVAVGVVTDVDLLEARYAASFELPRSKALETLLDGLKLIRGRPFTTRAGYAWAGDEQALQRAQQIVVDITCRVIELAQEADDCRSTLIAVSRAERAVDDPMTQFPYRLLEAEAANGSGQRAALVSVREYLRRLSDHVGQSDPSAECEMPLA
jgi:hypothetical protein